MLMVQENKVFEEDIHKLMLYFPFEFDHMYEILYIPHIYNSLL